MVSRTRSRSPSSPKASRNPWIAARRSASATRASGATCSRASSTWVRSSASCGRAILRAQVAQDGRATDHTEIGREAVGRIEAVQEHAVPPHQGEKHVGDDLIDIRVRRTPGPTAQHAPRQGPYERAELVHEACPGLSIALCAARHQFGLLPTPLIAHGHGQLSRRVGRVRTSAHPTRLHCEAMVP